MIVILTALSVEQSAVLEHMVNPKPHRHRGTIFDVGALAACPQRQVALGLTGTGALDAAALTERALSLFSPAAMIFVGIAGGLATWLEIGDVVVATKVYAYQGGKSEDDGFRHRPRAWQISHELEQEARRLPRDNAWRAGLPATGAGSSPTVHFGVIAAGDIVLNSTSSPEARTIRDNYNDAVAVEMESSGSALAAHLGGRVPMATVRGISDRADGTKSATDADGGQQIAARNAAAFAVALAAAVDDHTAGPPPPSTHGSVRVPPEVRNTNIAAPHSQVGQQNGINFNALHADWSGEKW